MEAGTSARSEGDKQDAAPVRRGTRDGGKVCSVDNQGQCLEGLAVDLQLARQTSEGIVGALDLVALDVPADHGDIDAPAGVGESQLIENEGVVTNSKAAKVTLAQRRSDTTFGDVGSRHRMLTSPSLGVAKEPHSIEARGQRQTPSRRQRPANAAT